MKKTIIVIFAVACFWQAGQAQTRQWMFETEGKIYGSPTLAEGNVVIGSEDGHVYAVDAATGQERWRYQTGGAVYASPVYEEGMLYVGSHDGAFYSLSAKDGTRKWIFQTGGEKFYDTWDYYLSTPSLHGDLVLFGSGDGHVYALNKHTGVLQWKFQTGDAVHAEIAIAEEIVYVGSFDGRFYALDVKDGTPVWTFKTVGDTYFPKGEIQKGALVRDGVVYFGSRDYNIYALDAKTGTGRWNMKERGSWVIATPAFDAGRIFFGTSDSHSFYSMDAQSGAVIWTLPLNMRVYGSAVPVDGILYFGCFNGKLYAVNAEKGDVMWTYQTEGSKANYAEVYDASDHFKEGFELYNENWQQTELTILSLGSILSTPLVHDGVVYFGSADGHLYAVALP